jgi:RNA polymerase sigma-70 factor (ECF subfamily)
VVRLRFASACDATSASLLGRLRSQADQTAWDAFVERYRHMIYAWCRRRGLQDADAEDVTQEVLTILAEAMSSFEYDPAKGKFRNYLQVVTRRAVGHRALRNHREVSSGGVASQRLLKNLQAREALANRLQREFDQELLALAQERVARRVDPRTLQAFQLTAIEGLTGVEAAARLRMKVEAVYMARSRVQKLLRRELGKLDPSVALT